MKFFSLILPFLYCSASEAGLRQLQTSCALVSPISISGVSCDYSSIRDAILTENSGCVSADVVSFLGVGSEEEAMGKVIDLCEKAHAGTTEYPFEDVFKKGYQYDREFFNGGTGLNTFESPTTGVSDDAARVVAIKAGVSHKYALTWPSYLTNFNADSCSSQAAMCCWIADKYQTGTGSCTEGTGCADGDPSDNTDICRVDMANSPRAAHTYKGVALFPGDSEGPAHCQGFVWDSSNKAYKGNALFEVALSSGLVGNGYTRSVPGAPMCACVEQMPVVSHSGCTDIIPQLALTLTQDAGVASIAITDTNIGFGNCDGKDLAQYYQERFNSDLVGKYVVGDCNSAAGVDRSIHLQGLVYKGDQ